MAGTGSSYLPLTEMIKLDGKIDVFLSIDIAKQDDAEEISQFLVDHYYSVPPINYLYGLCDGTNDVERLKAADLDYLRDRCLNQPYSLVIRKRRNGSENLIKGPLLGVLIMRVETKEEYERNLEPFQSGQWILLDIVNALHRDVNLFDTFQTDRLLHVVDGAVRQDLNCLGLSTKMIKLSMGLAWMEGAGAVVGEALGENSRRLSLKVGMKIFRTLDYATFLFRGSRPLADADLGGHRAAYLMGRRLLADSDSLMNQQSANNSPVMAKKSHL